MPLNNLTKTRIEYLLSIILGISGIVILCLLDIYHYSNPVSERKRGFLFYATVAELARRNRLKIYRA